MGKKQLYVPKFYLRRFSNNPTTPTHIAIYNIKEDKYILHGNLSNQCYKNKFYKTEKLEHNLSKAEGYFATILKTIDESNKAPTPNSNEHNILLHLLTLQYTRTPSAIGLINQLAEQTVISLFSEIAQKK